MKGKTVLITGGTSGIGRATGLAYGALGARVALTSRWPAQDLEQLLSEFQALGAPEPLLIEADVGRPEDDAVVVQALLDAGWKRVHAYISNVGFAQLVPSMESFHRRGLQQSVGYSAWPLVSYTRALHRAMGAWPRYIVAVSSQGAKTFHPNYDAAGCAKASLETLVRYLSHRLAEHGTSVNAVRPRWVLTPSLLATIGQDFPEFVRRWPQAGQFVEPEEVADAILALTSGWMDGMTGQILDVDHGCAFSDNLMRLYAMRQATPPSP